MESLDGYSHKYQYSIVGHSGDSAEIPLVDFGKPPQNRKVRILDFFIQLSPSKFHNFPNPQFYFSQFMPIFRSDIKF
jgi:hypothetical protein